MPGLKSLCKFVGLITCGATILAMATESFAAPFPNYNHNRNDPSYRMRQIYNRQLELAKKQQQAQIKVQQLQIRATQGDPKAAQEMQREIQRFQQEYQRVQQQIAYDQQRLQREMYDRWKREYQSKVAEMKKQGYDTPEQYFAAQKKSMEQEAFKNMSVTEKRAFMARKAREERIARQKAARENRIKGIGDTREARKKGDPAPLGEADGGAAAPGGNDIFGGGLGGFKLD